WERLTAPGYGQPGGCGGSISAASGAALGSFVSVTCKRYTVFHNFDERYPYAMADTASKLDARVQRSRLRLRQALVELVLERGYDSVTIRDLTSRADVGYATFFRHFQDKDALLRSLLDELLDELMSLLAPSLADADASRTGTLVFEHVQQNADLYRVLISSQRSVDLVSRAASLG